MAQALIAMWLEIDLGDVLPSISVPTLVLNRAEEIFPSEAARELAARIPGARHVELPGVDHLPWAGDSESYFAEIEEFLTGKREPPPSDRVLATILVTDLVASTERAAALGDRAWRELMSRHDGLVRERVRRFGGRRSSTRATASSPRSTARPAASAALEASPGAGESSTSRSAPGSTPARSRSSEMTSAGSPCTSQRGSAPAGPGEVLVSRTVKELVIGSEIAFTERGTRRLRGLPANGPCFSRPRPASGPRAGPSSRSRGHWATGSA